MYSPPYPSVNHISSPFEYFLRAWKLFPPPFPIWPSASCRPPNPRSSSPRSLPRQTASTRHRQRGWKQSRRCGGWGLVVVGSARASWPLAGTLMFFFTGHVNEIPFPNRDMIYISVGAWCMCSSHKKPQVGAARLARWPGVCQGMLQWTCHHHHTPIMVRWRVCSNRRSIWVKIRISIRQGANLRGTTVWRLAMA